MIGYIAGEILSKDERRLLIHAGGLGYEVEVAASVLLEYEIGETIRLYTYLHVREDAMELYGFLSVKDKNLFLKLIGVSSIGPRSAMQILSAVDASTLIQWLTTNDTAHLVKLPGIGAKTAARLVLELKDKLPALEMAAEPHNAEKDIDPMAEDPLFDALMSLGYTRAEIESVHSILEETRDQAEGKRLKVVLKALSKEV